MEVVRAEECLTPAIENQPSIMSPVFLLKHVKL